MGWVGKVELNQNKWSYLSVKLFHLNIIFSATQGTSNDKCGGGGGFYLSAHISQSIHPRKINLVLNDIGQKSYLESTLILAILCKIFS